MTIPTIEELAQVFTEPVKAQEILTIHIEDLLANNKSARRRVAECFHRPSDVDIRFHALNDLERLYGVEGIEIGFNDFIDYLNTGDTYATTLLHHKGRFWVGSWYDEVKRREL